MKFRITYRGSMWGNPYRLERKYKWWPWWISVGCFSSMDAAMREAQLLRTNREA